MSGGHGDLEHTTTLANNQASVVGFLDQTKAFDRVDWHWKDKCLQNLISDIISENGHK